MARIVITGGTGSFGNAAVQYFLGKDHIHDITVFSRDEKKQHDMRHDINSPKMNYIIGDIRDYDSLLYALRDADYVFHAAALKHVPTGEYSPVEMIRTNILGSENVIRAAEENGVKKVVVLSTDKAVYPINMLGLTKGIAEKLTSARARTSKNTTFMAVRYGNVMASRGSVIPLFVEQIKQGKDITITDPEMTRFLLSLDDSISLVDAALTKGEQGDIFIKKAPAATIKDIAEALQRIFKASNPIKVIGTRTGEKIHETLATSFELARAQDIGEYYRIKGEGVAYEDFYDKGDTHKLPSDYTSEVTKRLSPKEVEDLLRSLPYIQEELKKSGL